MKRKDINAMKFVASEGSYLVEKTSKDNIKRAITKGVCNCFNPTKLTPMSTDIMVKHIGIVGENQRQIASWKEHVSPCHTYK